MKKSYINILACMVLLLATVMAGVAFIKKPAQSVHIESKPEANENRLNVIKAEMWDKMIPLMADDDRMISDATKLQDTTDAIYSLKKLTKGRYTLVVRYSFMDCDMCIDTMLTHLHKSLSKRKYKDLIVVTDADSENDYLVKVRAANKPFPIYNLPSGSLGLSIENKNFPFMFVLNPQQRVTKIFVPLKEIAYQIDDYLNYVSAYLDDVNAQIK